MSYRVWTEFSWAILTLAWPLIAAGLPAPAQAQPAKPRIAVLEFERIEVGEAEGAAVTNQLRSELVNLRVFTVLERSQTEAVLEELAFQQVGVTDPGRAARIGRLLNVQYIVTGRLTALADAYQVHAQMIRVETAEIERSESIVYRGDIVALLSERMPALARRLAGVEGTQPGERGVAAEPEYQAGKSAWPLWVGGVAILAAVGLQRSAVSTDDEAEEKAEAARLRNDPALFREAEELQSDAETQEAAAIVLGGIGAALVLYYLFSGDEEPGLAFSGRPLRKPFPVAVAITPNSVAARYSLRW